MKLIVGLGNPGSEYEKTRHNAGFLAIDMLARRHAPGEVARSRFHASTIDSTIGDEKVILIKPVTYMNRSGLSVAEAVRFYKLEPSSDVLIIVDDVALPVGAIRLRQSGGAGGHNGLADIQQKLGSDQYDRLRIGIDAPGQIPQKDYVLGRFRPDQLDDLESSLEDAVRASECWVREGILEAMNRFNTKAVNLSPPVSAGAGDSTE